MGSSVHWLRYYNGNAIERSLGLRDLGLSLSSNILLLQIQESNGSVVRLIITLLLFLTSLIVRNFSRLPQVCEYIIWLLEGRCGFTEELLAVRRATRSAYSRRRLFSYVSSFPNAPPAFLLLMINHTYQYIV